MGCALACHSDAHCGRLGGPPNSICRNEGCYSDVLETLPDHSRPHAALCRHRHPFPILSNGGSSRIADHPCRHFETVCRLPASVHLRRGTDASRFLDEKTRFFPTDAEESRFRRILSELVLRGGQSNRRVAAEMIIHIGIFHRELRNQDFTLLFGCVLGRGYRDRRGFRGRCQVDSHGYHPFL